MPRCARCARSLRRAKRHMTRRRTTSRRYRALARLLVKCYVSWMKSAVRRPLRFSFHIFVLQTWEKAVRLVHLKLASRGFLRSHREGKQRSALRSGLPQQAGQGEADAGHTRGSGHDDAHYHARAAARGLCRLGVLPPPTELRACLEKGTEEQISCSQVDPVVYNMLHESPGQIDYSTIGGLSDQIRDLREAIELPLMNPEIFLRVGIKPPKARSPLCRLQLLPPAKMRCTGSEARSLHEVSTFGCGHTGGALVRAAGDGQDAAR